MDKRIFKYEIDLATGKSFKLAMPKHAQVLDVQVQPGSGLVMWCLLDKDQPPAVKEFTMYGTGEKLPPYPGEYVCTIQALNPITSGMLVMHMFETIPEGE